MNNVKKNSNDKARWHSETRAAAQNMGDTFHIGNLLAGDICTAAFTLTTQAWATA